MATLLGGMHMRLSLRSLALCGAASLSLAACASTVGEAPKPAMLAASPTSPSNLKIESAPTLLGADVLRPRFQWLAPQATQTRQTHYRLQVATSEAGLSSGDLVWDSGEVASGDQAQIAYGGPDLASRGRYVWRVQTRDAQGRTSDWSSPAVWEMGLLQPGDWQARWISADAAAEHIWSDATTEWRFTPTGGDIDLLFRASPVGKTFGDAYAWRLGISEGQPTLTAISRTYDAKAQPLVKETTLKTVALPLTQTQWIGGPHTLTVEAKGARIVTRLDGVVIDTLENTDHRQGTAGVFQAGPSMFGPATPAPDAIVLHELTVTPASGPVTRAAFSGHDNPLSGGTVEADGLHIANARGVDIVFPQTAPAALLRRPFVIDGDVVQARLYIAAGGFPRIDINGKTINEAIGDGFTAYDRRVLYRTLDVTDQLRRGDNVIGLELGRGWYDLVEPNEWYWHEAPWRNRPTARLQLEVTLADGSRQIVTTDDKWRTHPGPTRHDSIYAGERYDARLAPSGWSQTGFDDRSWTAARLVQGPAGRLDAAEQQPIAVVGARRAVSLKQVRPGVWVYDFGSIFAGRLHLKVEGPAGQTVSMIQHEKLRPDGTVLSTSGLVDTQLQTDQYTLAGGGQEEWSPRFGYRGFRYVEVRGFPGTPTLDSLTGEVMHSDVASIGSFESSNPLLNQIQAAARTTILNNMHGFQTDTPTFEKNGWTGDAQASALASALNFDVSRVWTKWMGDFRDAQAPSGEIPEIVPSTPQYGYEDTPGWNMVNGPTPSWDAATFILPDDLYQLTGDTRLLAEMYDTQKRLVDYTASWFTPGDFHYRQLANTFLGEYANPRPPISPEMIAAFMAANQAGGPPPQPGASDVDSVATAYLFHMTQMLANNAALLGKEADARTYAARAQAVRAAYNRTYWDEARGMYRVPAKSGDAPTFVQYQNILPVAFGIVPDGQADAVLQKVNDDIVAHDYHLSSMGVFSGRYALTLLSDAGHVDTVYRVATQTTEPSWGFWLANDIHTMLEGWSLNSRSYDHHYWGLVSSWFYQSLAGIRPGAPGYQTIVIRPEAPQGLDHVAAHLDTVRGRISSEWRRIGDHLILDVGIPAGSRAEIWCPGEAARIPGNAQFLRQDGKHWVYSIGGGNHRFECAARAA